MNNFRRKVVNMTDFSINGRMKKIKTDSENRLQQIQKKKANLFDWLTVRL